MAAVIQPRQHFSQPMGVVSIDHAHPCASRLTFAVIPSLGMRNLVDNKLPTQQVESPKVVTGAGVNFAPGGVAKAEFDALLPDANGLTLISVWKCRANYLSADVTRYLFGNRTAGNTGWGWGRASAIGGGANGNLTSQTFVINGVAAYTESTYTIESYVDTPVACRYSQSSGKVSWFRFGRKSSVDTTASTSPTVGDKITLGALGPYGAVSGPWIDYYSVVLGFAGELSDAEIFDLTCNNNAPFRLFKAD